MTFYKVTFKVNGKTRIVTLPQNRGIADITNGFWVCADYDWCVASKVKYYVMPHQITLVEKC